MWNSVACVDFSWRRGDRCIDRKDSCGSRAGWVGAIISAGRLSKDVAEYSSKYNLSPEGQENR